MEYYTNPILKNSSIYNSKQLTNAIENKPEARVFAYSSS